jgi:hypothetical protein
MDTDEQRERREKIFEQEGIPKPDGLIIDASYRMDNGDWFVQLDPGDWYWYDKRDKGWKFLPWGRPD